MNTTCNNRGLAAKACAGTIVALALFAFSADGADVVASLDFSSSARTLSPECRADAGRISLYVEDRSWNTCGKCEVTKGEPDRDHPGHIVFAANALIGFVGARRGFPVKAGCRYDVSFDVKSLVGEMAINADVVAWTGDEYWKDRRVVKSVVPGGVKASGEWRTFKGSFRVPEGAVCAVLRLSIWSSTRWEKTRQFAVGDAFLFDNVRLSEKLTRFRDEKFSVAPVSKTSDWAQPFLPEEIFDPPSNIVLKAAVNEIAALPLAVANLSGRVEDYSVVLETDGGVLPGGFGLGGFPPEKVRMLKGVRIRDVDGPSPSTRFDPLVKMDDAGTITVPPREAGLVWCDFDCTGVLPGRYNGFLRVIPLCEEGRLSGCGENLKYGGKMQIIPLSLEVVNAEIPLRPAIPAQYFMPAASEEVFDAAFQIGAEAFQIHSWAFAFERDAAGNLDLNRPKKAALGIAATVRSHVAWAKKYGFSPKFVIVYSAMEACEGLYGCAKDDAAFRRIWPQYVRGLKKTMNEAGVADSDYVVEVKDEPKPNALGRVLEAHKMAKEACPTVRLMMLLAAWKPTVGQMREFVPYADVWNFWSDAYFKTDEYISFVRDIKAAGQSVRSYSCETTIRMSPLHYYRHHAWRAERRRLDGIDMYQLFTHIHHGELGRKDFATTPGSGIIYGSFGKPVLSLRYMALREGFTDCKMLAALRARKDLRDRHDVADFLRSVATGVIDRHPNDAAFPERMRDQAREMLKDVVR